MNKFKGWKSVFSFNYKQSAGSKSYIAVTTLVAVIIIAAAILISVLAAKPDKDEILFTVIKQIDYYKEHLEPAWEYPVPDDQWLFAETVTEHVGTKFDILCVFADETYKEIRGLSQVPEDAWEKARTNIDYHQVKRRYKKRWWWMK